MLYTSICVTLRREQHHFPHILDVHGISIHIHRRRKRERRKVQGESQRYQKEGESQESVLPNWKKEKSKCQTNNLQRWHPEMVLKALCEERRWRQDEETLFNSLFLLCEKYECWKPILFLYSDTLSYWELEALKTHWHFGHAGCKKVALQLPLSWDPLERWPWEENKP